MTVIIPSPEEQAKEAVKLVTQGTHTLVPNTVLLNLQSQSRREALVFANNFLQGQNAKPEEVVERAETYFKFLQGEANADE